MKTLLLVRHAKSDADISGLPDFDRPLNERGKRDAPVMASRLLEKKIPIDAFVASPARRAAKTAKIFAEAYHQSKQEIRFMEELYLPAASVFYSVIERMDDSLQHIAVFSHNYGITDFANELTNARIDNIPTCGIFAVRIHCDSWKDFRKAGKEFWFFDAPKAKG
ncbi:MAG: histidine phosphatase family protein [Sphingobacteriales bacterium]|nr:histidine phosphatase family protein [Sphingobacteriales bacterium]